MELTGTIVIDNPETTVSTRIFALIVSLGISLASGQVPDSAVQNTAPNEHIITDPLDRQTPYGCVRGFLLAAGRGDYSRAAEYLDVLASPSREQELARQLETVLNSERSGSLDSISRKAEGDLHDGLPADRERAGYVQTPSGRLELLLQRVHRSNSSPIWLFSPQTLKAVPKAFEEIGTPRIAQFLLPHTLTLKFLSVPLWRWLAIILAITLSILLASVISRILGPLLRRMIFRITPEEDDERLLTLSGPLRLIFFAFTIRILGGFADSLLSRQFWAHVATFFVVLGFSWLAIQLSDFMSASSSQRLLRKGQTGKLAIVALVRRLFKIVALIVAVIVLLRDAGVNVTAMLAGVGVGGIALALAAQKTLENLFGGISVIMREAIRVGDFCKIADQTGTVEDIGLGSTSIRTLDRTLISVPNAQIAQINLENMSMRDKFWFHHVLGLRRDTSPEQMRSVLNGINEMFRNHPQVEVETARIQFIAFGASSLDVEIFAYIRENSYESFLAAQQDLLLVIIDIVAASGTTLSLPSQTTYLEDHTAPALVNHIPANGKLDESPSSAREARHTRAVPGAGS